MHTCTYLYAIFLGHASDNLQHSLACITTYSVPGGYEPEEDASDEAICDTNQDTHWTLDDRHSYLTWQDITYRWLGVMRSICFCYKYVTKMLRFTAII